MGKSEPTQASYTHIAAMEPTNWKRLDSAGDPQEDNHLQAAIANATLGWFDCELASGRVYCSMRFGEMLGYKLSDSRLPQTLVDLRSLIEPSEAAKADELLFDSILRSTPFHMECRMRRTSGEYHWFEARAEIVADKSGVPHRLAGYLLDISERKAAEERAERRAELYRNAVDASDAFVYQLDFASNSFSYIGGSVEKLLGCSPSAFTPELWSRITEPVAGNSVSRDELIAEMRSGVLTSWRRDYKVSTLHGETRWMAEYAVRQLDESGNTMGVVGTIQDVTDRVETQRRTEVQYARLAALRAIDIAILSDNTICQTMGVVVDQIVSLLGIDSAAFMLLNDSETAFEHCSAAGMPEPFHSLPIAARDDALGRSLVQGFSTAGLSTGEFSDDHPRMLAVKTAGYTDYFAIPLLSRGKVRGVIELFHRAPMHTDADWKDYLFALVGQATIALETYSLVRGLKRSNEELEQAYDTTIEGWAQALDYRDKETEGHSRRVTELTVRLAREMGFEREQLIHIRRGALLHDIGKMAIPDRILQKPGPLTSKEMAEMRMHTAYGHSLLAPIAFMRDSLDIPLSHHERWDGTGYPNGLKGDEIPLAARLFAIIDVYDALRSDRPYRKAWPEEQVRRHILESSGTHFDPAVVNAFMKMLGANEG